MRHVSEILQELGFNKDAPETVQLAFLRHLMRAAVPQNGNPRHPESAVGKPCAPIEPEQLSFHFDDFEAAPLKASR